MNIIEKKPAQPNQSIIDAMTMLQAVVSADEPVGCTQLAREYGLDVTRVNRLLGTLAYLGVLKRTRSRKYVSGAGVHVLAAMSMGSSDLIRCSVPHVKALERKTKMIGTVGLLWRTQVTYIHYTTRHGQTAALPHSAPGMNPAQDAATGRVMLAQYPNDEIRRQFKEYDKDKSVNIRDLLAILDRVRENGYARGANRNTVAVGIGEPAVAGLGLMPRGKEKPPIPEKDIPGLLEHLREAAAAIARDMAEKRSW